MKNIFRRLIALVLILATLVMALPITASAASSSQNSIPRLLEKDNVTVWKNGEKTVYVQGEKTKWDYAPKNIDGTTMVPITIAVEVLGGSFLYWDSSTSSAYIELDGYEVEYQKNNTKYWVNGKRKTANQKAQIVDEKLYVELKTLTKLTSQSVDYKDGYVFISDDGLSSKEIKQIIDYLYYGKTEDDGIIIDIKAGKVYVTSIDGKHIYKRTYDSSKSCKYTDVYVCTIFNIDIPGNTVFIQEGNYLYEDGEKAYANVETLQQVDKRISQLNRIIDGAQNAYDNDVISSTRRKSIRNNTRDIIEEYEYVAYGEKKLSKVSEEKASYTAKSGDKNSTVEKIQQKLYDLGYTSQLVTGCYDEVTLNNIAYLQIVKGLTVNGWVDEQTYKVLVSSKTDISEEIETIQKQADTLPLSKVDIEKGVKVVTVGANQYYDCTEVLNEVFVNAAKEAQKHQLLNPNLLLCGSVIATSADGINLLWFVSKVYHFQEWDIKREKSWEITVGTTFPGDNKMVMFYGKLYTVSELGNMLYGYAGTAMKIPEEILYMGGGFAETKSHEFIFLEDYGDGEDRPLIKEGIEWYKKEH